MAAEINPNNMTPEQLSTAKALISAWETVCALRDPASGCPWDRQQTHQSLLRYLIEESYEFCHAVQNGQDASMRDELGDVLFQVLLHSCLGKERKAFDLAQVADQLREKLVRRHPHVFAAAPHDAKLSPDEVAQRWEAIKSQEQAENKNKNLLGDSWRSAPALLAAFKIGEKTQKIKFDWDNYQQVAYKVEEEWQELKEEIASGTVNRARAQEEIGDLLFTVAQLARHLDLEPEMALAAANKKFADRFHKMQKLIEEDGKDIEQMNQAQMDAYWNKVKLLARQY